jgi:hypothetical protein
MRLLRFMIGVAFLPLCWVVTRTAMSLTQHAHLGTDHLIPPSTLALGGGFLAWLAVFYLLPTPVRSYVLAHELTHAIWATLMGARVSKIKVKKQSGYVALSKTNFLIALAPYFFPLYTMIVIAAYGVSSMYADVSRFLLLWLGVVGFTWGFHFTFTITTLMQHQTDVHQYGRLFSYTVIYFANVAGICIWIAAVSSVTVDDVAEYAANHSRSAVTTLCSAWEWGEGLLQRK